MSKPLAAQTPTAPASIARAVLALTALLLPAAALAHPGHGDGGFWPGFLHAFHGLDHVLAALAVGVWGARLGGRALWAVPLAFVAAMAAGVALAAGGIAVPMPEPIIAASVLILGALLTFDVRVPLAIGALLVGAFAVAHAAAHVAELTAQGAIVTYASGLLLSTALLHAAGIGGAFMLRRRPTVVRIAAAPIALVGLWLVAVRVL